MNLTHQKGIDFVQVVNDQYNSLTKSEKRIANFLRKNQEESAFLSAGEIAHRLALSEATLVRFARKLGFSSYPEMRGVLQGDFRQRVTHSARLRGRLSEIQENGGIFERLTTTEIDYLTQALVSIDTEEMDRAVELIKTHPRIYVFGLGPSVSLVDLMEIRLRRFGKTVMSLKVSGREVIDSMLAMQADDLVFVICFFDQNPTLRLVLDYSKKVGATVIMLTDILDTILSDKADVILSARRGPVGEFHSLVVPMTIINALLLSVANADQENIMPALDKLDSLRDKLKELNESGVFQ
ncbi:MAG: MurR/RpiR family transcriptional regulator [Anaerolineaceae bacterium]|nr:MurR/RpiR family transcriptional regulator [Anaerolineaceae bacterium]